LFPHIFAYHHLSTSIINFYGDILSKVDHFYMKIWITFKCRSITVTREDEMPVFLWDWQREEWLKEHGMAVDF